MKLTTAKLRKMIKEELSMVQEQDFESTYALRLAKRLKEYCDESAIACEMDDTDDSRIEMTMGGVPVEITEDRASIDIDLTGGDMESHANMIVKLVEPLMKPSED